MFQVATSEPPSPPPVPVTLTIVPPPDDAVLYSPPPPYEPTDEHDSAPGNATRFLQHRYECYTRKYTTCKFHTNLHPGS